MEFYVINSFTNVPFKGNPAGVVLLEQQVDEITMQNIAAQLNLVETVFVEMVDETTYKMRYFTPYKELPIAGHPTIAAMKLLDMKTPFQGGLRIMTAGGIVLANKASLPTGTIYQVQFGDVQYGALIQERKSIADVLGIRTEDFMEQYDIRVVDAGLGHIIVPVKDLNALMRIKRNIIALKSLCEAYGAREVQAFTTEVYDVNHHIHTRNICPREGIEDPACGVGNAALLAYLSQISTQKAYRLEQGHINGFEAVIHGTIINNQTVRIGGHATVMAKGSFCGHMGCS